jgi:MFS family permease
MRHFLGRLRTEAHVIEASTRKTPHPNAVLPAVHLIWIAVLALFPVAAGAQQVADSLPTGIVSETTFLTVVLRVVAVAWGAFLLLMGVRRPRSTLATFYLAVALLVGLLVGGKISYLVSLLVTVAILTFATMLIVWLRRVATGFACFWPLVALYAAHLYFSGSFERSMPLAITLAAAGVALGAVLPRVGSALLAAALGTSLVLVVSPIKISFWLIALIAGGSLTWQLLLILRVRRPLIVQKQTRSENRRVRMRRFAETLRWGVGALTMLVLLIVLLAPQYGPGIGAHPARIATLVNSGNLEQPSLVFLPSNNLYLSGQALPLAILAPQPGFFSRIILPFVGRNSTGAIHRQRAVKDDAELAKMRRAAAITSQAFSDIAPLILPGANEAEIETAIIDSFRRNRADGIAFDSIVGSGPNAVLPHYGKNNADMTTGMVVIDIGCSVEGYASDMTRSFPVRGTLTTEQQMLVDTVNAAGDAARSMLRAGVTMRELDSAARKVIEEAGFGPFFLHSLGHYVGLSVHDPPANELRAGMVITIEPGIYISEGSDIAPEFWNLGVRIEDSYIVTEEGYEEITSYPR